MKEGYKIPICGKCGKTLKGKVPIDATNIICFFCDNPPLSKEELEEETTLTRWKDTP
jgi:hypothetical protein